MRIASLVLPGLIAVLSPAALADTVKLKNGDTLTGTVVSIVDGKLTLNTAAAGDVTIDLAQVDSFATDAPARVEVKRAGSSETDRVEGKIALASGGSISVAAEGGARAVALGDLASVNRPVFEPNWSGSLLGSATWTRGNTDLQQAALDLNAVHRGIDDRFTLLGWYRTNRQKDQTTGDTSTTERRAGASGKYDWFFSKANYAYGMAQGEKDAIANIDLRFTAGAGVGWQVIDQADANFNVEAGLSWFVENYSDNTSTVSDPSARAAWHYDRKLTEKYSTKFFHDIDAYKVFAGPDDYLVHTKGGLQENLTGSFFAQQWVEFTWDSTPATGKKRQDVTYYFGIGWTF